MCSNKLLVAFLIVVLLIGAVVTAFYEPNPANRPRPSSVFAVEKN